MSRINTYPEVDRLNSDDFLIVDGATNGTRKIKASEFSKDNDGTFEIPFYPFQFVRAYRQASNNSLVNNNGYATSIASFKLNGKGRLHFTISGTNLKVKLWKLNSTEDGLVQVFDYTTDAYAEGSSGKYYIVFHATTGDISSANISQLHVTCNKGVFDDFVETNFIKLTKSGKFSNYGENAIFRNGYDPDLKMGMRNQTKNRLTVYPYYAVDDCTIYSPSFNTAYIIIIENDTLYTLQKGMRHTIAKGTYFGVAFINGTSATEHDGTTHICYEIKNAGYNDEYGNQLLQNSTISRSDSQILVGDLIFMVTYGGDLYHVYSLATGDYIKKEQQLDHTVGHANSGNYDNGCFYVSDWTINNVIHVFDVDTETPALTYSKDITLPENQYGRVEYYVQQEEKEIYFLGWQNGDSATDPNNLVYGLYVKSGDTYVLAWEKKARRVKTLQSFTKQGDCFYFVEVETGSGYTTQSICELNLHTGEIKQYPVSGTLATREGETLMPIGKKTFIIGDAHGYLFFYAIG